MPGAIPEKLPPLYPYCVGCVVAYRRHPGPHPIDHAPTIEAWLDTSIA